MADRIRVYAIKFPDRPAYQLQWTDPATGRKKTKSARTANRREAERKAIDLEDQLNQHGCIGVGELPFDDFFNRFDEEHVAGLSVATRKLYDGIRARIEDRLDTGLEPLNHFDAAFWSRYVASRRHEAAETTIEKDLRHIRAMLKWAHQQELIDTIPKIPKLTRARTSGVDDEMRGRPITDDEFQLFRKSAAGVVESLQLPWLLQLIDGLWLSGLRISEAIALRWEAGDWPSIDQTGKHWSLLIPGKQKSGKHERAPLMPDFVEWLAGSVPENMRQGFVFQLIAPSGERITSVAEWSRTMSNVGKASGIITDPVAGTHVTAHDLRRSFAARWIVHFQPHVMQKVMRHANIQTTQRYYAGVNLDRAQDEIAQTFAAIKSRTGQANRKANRRQNEI